jgi:hypothetical protein
MLLFGTGVPVFAVTMPAQSKNSGVHAMLVNTDYMSTDLSFSGDKAECTAIIYGKSGTNKIKADVYLMRVNGNVATTIKHWSATTYSNELDFYKEYYVASGYTYKLEIDAAVTRNGTTEYLSESSKAYCG